MCNGNDLRDDPAPVSACTAPAFHAATPEPVPQGDGMSPLAALDEDVSIRAASAARPPLVLIVAEHEWSVLSLESILAPAGFAVLRAHSGRQALERATAAAPDIIFLEAVLPDLDGVQVCRALRSHPRIPASTPILMVHSGEVSRQQHLGALRAGAWDLVRFPLDAEELLLRVESFVKAKFDADRARTESLVDPSTGLYSLRGILQRAQEIGAQAARYQRPLACLVLSLPPEPDPEPLAGALDALAATLRGTNRLSDVVGRMSEHDFVILAPDTDAEGARRLAERLVDALGRGQAQVGCYAVPNFHDAAIEPIQMLVRASQALRASRSGETPATVRFFEQLAQSPPAN
jgi:PleD family two-component response regulator